MHNKDTSTLLKKHSLILDILNKNNIDDTKLVGGCVRDFLKYNIIPEDIDISTILEPEQVISLLNNYKKQNDKYIITILDKDKFYGTIVVIFEDRKTHKKQKYEITTTRSDIVCFGRQAKVKFCKDFQQDSARRDFTINALYLGQNGEILDFHNGMEDLTNNKIAFIGNAEDRIKEDYLRIIRFFRFATKFNNFDFDQKVIDIIKSNKIGLLKLSRERIKNEIFKMLECDNWFLGLKSLHQNNLITEIFQIENYSINRAQDTKLDGNLIKLIYFFNYDINIMEDFKEKLKFTREEKKLCDFIIQILNLSNNGAIFNIDVKLQIYKNHQLFLKCQSLFSENLQKEIDDFIKKIKPLPIKPIDLINLGINGKNIGEKIDIITKIWLKNDFTNTKNELLSFVI